MARVFSSSTFGSDIVRQQRVYTKDDLVKTRVIFQILFLLAFVAILSLGAIWCRVQVVQLGYDLNHLRQTQNNLLEEERKLRVELLTLKAPQRIERVALEKLKMQSPTPEQIEMMQ